MKFSPVYQSLWDRNPFHYFTLLMMYVMPQILIFWLFFNSLEFWIASGFLIFVIGLSFFLSLRNYKFFCTRLEFFDSHFEMDYLTWGKDQKNMSVKYSDISAELSSIYSGRRRAKFRLRFKQADIRCDIVSSDNFWTKERFWTVVYLLKNKEVDIHLRDSMFGIYIDELMAEMDLPYEEGN